MTDMLFHVSDCAARQGVAYARKRHLLCVMPRLDIAEW
jgi:hypothetical protein